MRRKHVGENRRDNFDILARELPAGIIGGDGNGLLVRSVSALATATLARRCRRLPEVFKTRKSGGEIAHLDHPPLFLFWYSTANVPESRSWARNEVVHRPHERFVVALMPFGARGVELAEKDLLDGPQSQRNVARPRANKRSR